MAYWVWIPRYEYRTYNTSKEDDYIAGDVVLKEFLSVHFIDKTVTAPTLEGFKIPDAFTWDGNPIPGYWVSKYDVSEGIVSE